MTDLTIINNSLDQAVKMWLFDKEQHSGSSATLRTYRGAMQSFRLALWSQRLDLDSEPRAVGMIAQVWAAARDRDAARRGESTVKGATYNKRLAALSSFYKFAMRRNLAGIGANPISQMERHSTADSQHAPVLTSETVAEALGKIDRSTQAGMRDYTILAIAFATGRRAAEIADLRCGDIQQSNGAIILHFRHCKGGKAMDDKLDGRLASLLLRYVGATHGTDLSLLDADAPLWMTYSRNGKTTGKPITTQAVADICKKHIGVSTMHSTRHTFAKMMDDQGAPLTTIQRRLGHTNVAITAKYLHSLPQPENPYAGALADALGIEE